MQIYLIVVSHYSQKLISNNQQRYEMIIVIVNPTKLRSELSIISPIFLFTNNFLESEMQLLKLK